MFNSGILDVAIGIVFVYLLVSLIVTAVNELIAAIFQMRGRVLWDGICDLLPSAKGRKNIAHQVFTHSLIEGLSRGRRPSYIPSRTFALALLDVVSGGTGKIASLGELETRLAQLPEGVQRPLQLMLQEANGSVERFKTGIEIWFNNAMDRVSGVYKRKVQYALFFLSFLLAADLNVDTIVLANRLSHDSALRAALVSQAEVAAKQPAPTAAGPALEGRSLTDTIRQLDELKLPIGWSGTDPDLRSPDFQKIGWLGALRDVLQRHLVGWTLTAFAATLGAPFWFDLLNRFINIRNAGKSPDEKPKNEKDDVHRVGIEPTTQ